MHIKQSRREIRFIRGTILAASIIFFSLFTSIAISAYGNFHHGHVKAGFSAVLFAVTVFFIGYGTFLYQFCLIGYYKRKILHKPATHENYAPFYQDKAPSLVVLVPSYKEEISVVRQTLLAAALSEYPQKNITLLIDDPYQPRALEDVLKLEKTRAMTQELQKLFNRQLEYYQAQKRYFDERRESGNLFPAIELNRLSLMFEQVALWLQDLSENCLEQRDFDKIPYNEQFFLNRMLLEPAQRHKAYAEHLRGMITSEIIVGEEFISRQYARLAGMFNVAFTYFERKKYVNLSQESNKAMNLNSYIGLIGKSWREVETKAGLALQECGPEEATFTIPAYDYVNTIDADTLMTPECVMSLIYEMEKPEHKRVAVAQSPCSTFPNCPSIFERAAGALIDMGFMMHQGYTHWNVGFWVGANAMLRREALEDIKEVRIENGHKLSVYIQDRTVIEDTESSVDLLYKGWHVYNHIERMTFSPTPPDFGALLIQRRRWANGGLIILPKLISHMLRAPKNLNMLKGFFAHFYYLGSATIGCFTMLLWMVYPFGDLTSNLLLPFTTLPFFLLFSRHLHTAGYRRIEMFHIYAANLMLMPVHTGGVLKQFQQIISGKKIPFGRTPKVPNRTAAPVLYYILELGILLGFSVMAVKDISHAAWLPAAYSAVNAGIMYYVFTRFVGVKAMAEDVATAFTSYWRNVSRQAEIIPMPVRSALVSDSASRISA